MDGINRFKVVIREGNSTVMGALLSELGVIKAKAIINECRIDENETALIHIVKSAGEREQKKAYMWLECCQLLLQYGADPNETDETGKTALHWACASKNVDVVGFLLNSGADPSIVDQIGLNSLHCAINAGSAECMRMILQHKKELVNAQDDDDIAPIMTAVQRGDEPAVRVLVLSGAEVNFQEKTTRRTALHYALYMRKKDIFEFLLDNGADVTKTDHRGTNIIHRCCAIEESSYLKIVLSKVSSTTDQALRMEDSEGVTPVIVACRDGNIEQLKMLVEAGAPVANRDIYRRCALHHCVENTDIKCAEYLLRSIPSLMACTDQEGLTSLHMAIIAGNIPLIKLLLKRGANLKAVDNEKHTVIHWATVCSHADVLKMLIEHGAELSTPDKHHAYPIHYAAQIVMKKSEDVKISADASNLQVLKILLKNKVSPEVEDKDKRTPIVWAASAGNTEACRLLAEHGSDVDKSDKDDLTALHCAASRGHTQCVMALICDCKAKVDAVDRNQCTPLFYATTHGHLNCIEVLLKLKADHTHTDINGRSATHCATVSGSTATLDILRDHNVDLWSRNVKGDQPLHEAAQSGHLDVVQYLLEHADSQAHAIDSSNNDGRTCLHIAALTNNVWLCKFLLEQGANVNALMKNRGKYYSPYDAALIKGHLEARDMLYDNNGRPGSAIANNAVRSIQLKYKYHRRRQQLLADTHKDVDDKTPRGINKVDASKICEVRHQASTEDISQYPAGISEDDDVRAKKYPEENNVEKMRAAEGEYAPKYVDKATQVKTYSVKQLANVSRGGMLYNERYNDSRNTIDRSPNIETLKDSPTPNEMSNSYKIPNEGTCRIHDRDKSPQFPKLYTIDTNKAETISHQQKGPNKDNKESDDLLVTSQSDSNDSQFKYASPRCSSSDTDSMASNDSRRKASAVTESFVKADNKTSEQTYVSRCSEKFYTEQAAESLLDDHQCNVYLQRKTESAKLLSYVILKEESAGSNKTLSRIEKQDYHMQHHKQTLYRYGKSDKPQTENVGSLGRKSGHGRGSNFVASQNGQKTSVGTNITTGKKKTTRQISAQRKLPITSVKYSGCTHVSSNWHNCESADRHIECSNAGEDDNSDKAVLLDKLVTRPRTTKPAGLVRSVQESVKRFESERRSLRQLYQTRRARIYGGQLNDAAALKKAFVSQSKGSDEVSSEATVYRFLSGHLSRDQEGSSQDEQTLPAEVDCDIPNYRHVVNGNGHSDPSTSQVLNSTRQRRAHNGWTSRGIQKTCNIDNIINGKDKDRSMKSNKTRQLTRAQTAGDIGTLNNHCRRALGNHRQLLNRETLQGKQISEQLLMKTYIPFGRVEILYKHAPRHRPLARERRPMSMISLGTSTSTSSSIQRSTSRANNKDARPQTYNRDAKPHA